MTFSADALPGLYAYVAVADDGPGMDRATQARIFDPFFSTKQDGRGLGLAAVQGIIRSHRGALLLSSHPGRGTTFKVWFPIEDAMVTARRA
jgi:signal transduction histidine kinase